MKKIIPLLLCLLLTGCFNYNELNNLAVITTIGIDNNYDVSFLISTDTESNAIVKGNGDDLSSSFLDAIKKLSKTAYFGHLKLILINSNVAKEGLSNIVDSLVRNYETIKKLKLVLVEDTTTYDILNTPITLDNFSSNNIIDIISNSNKRLSNSSDVLLSSFVYKMINYGYDNVLPVITIKDNNIEVKNIGVFSYDKLVGYLDLEESIIFNILMNKSNTFDIKLDDITLRIDSSKSKTNLSKYNFSFDLYLDGFVIESTKEIDFNKDTINYINNLLDEKIMYLTDSLIKHSISLNSDFLGLGNRIYKSDFNLYKENYMNLINYTINVHSNIRNQGSIENSLKEDKL